MASVYNGNNPSPNLLERVGGLLEILDRLEQWLAEAALPHRLSAGMPSGPDLGQLLGRQERCASRLHGAEFLAGSIIKVRKEYFA